MDQQDRTRFSMPVATPDFFIVGAPRCGTTAMYEYLRAHPDVYMPLHKEPMYFGQDLTQLHVRLTERDYLALFAEARPGQRTGEATTWYLFSKTAASEIREFSPDARIIIMLRHPVDVMYSLHRELLFYRGETIDDFAEALAAEPDRREGRRLGPSRRPEVLLYRQAVHFAEQVERYLDVFGRERVKIILFDDFIADVEAEYADVLRFLGVDETFRPEFRRVNESKEPLNRTVQAMMVRPPAPVAKLIPLLRRSPFAHRVRAALLAFNSRPVDRPPMPTALRQQLMAEFEPEIRRLAALIDRDLSGWLPADEPERRLATA